MKNQLLFALFASAFLTLGCSERSYFGEAGMLYHRSKAKPVPPELKRWTEGIYRFDICAHDTLIYSTNVQWYCDCTDPESDGSVDSFAMAFVDEIRVVFFKRPKPGREIALTDPGKEAKVGVYYWEFENPNGSIRARPLLIVRINSIKSKNKENDFSDLFFEKRGENLELIQLTYFDDDSSLTDLTRRRKKKNKGIDISPKGGLKTIRPKEAFAVSKMIYQFVPEPIILKLDGKTVTQIQYVNKGADQFIRTTSLAKVGPVEEHSDLAKTIKSW